MFTSEYDNAMKHPTNTDSFVETFVDKYFFIYDDNFDKPV